MTAAELIKELQQVEPTTPVTIATADGTKEIEAVQTLGYCGGAFAIIIED